jgi:hypothetical protein
VTQAAVCLPSKHVAEFKPSAIKKKKKAEKSKLNSRRATKIKSKMV